MIFEKLSLDTLCLLKSQGYNILTSKSSFEEDNLIWYPDRLIDINGYLLGVKVKGMHSISDCRILLVDDAIIYYEELDLIGDVFMWL